MNARLQFYHNVLSKRITDRSASILVCGGGNSDKKIFQMLGYTNVTISNLDERMDKDAYAPFDWGFENVEALSYDDNSFDYVVIHAAVHHTALPHTSLTEMYRVSSKGFLAFESRDSYSMRFLQKFNLVQTYEHAAVYNNGGKYGGVNNSEIPNYVYRWTEKEIEKTIYTYAPYCKHNFYFDYGLDAPRASQLEKGSIKKIIITIAQPFFFIVSKLFPKQQNLFAFFIEKPNLSTTKLWPWLTYNKELKKVLFNDKWAKENYS